MMSEGKNFGFNSAEELQQFIEDQGYHVTSLKIFPKSRHFRIAYSCEEYRAVAWEQYPFENLTRDDAERKFPKRGNAS